MAESKDQVQTKEQQSPSNIILDKLKKVYANAMLNAGKNNHNPHVWLRDNYQKLDDAVKKGPITKELEAAVMALPDNPDTRIDKSLSDSVTNPKK